MNHISFYFVVRKDVTTKEGVAPVYLSSRFNNKNFRVKLPLRVIPTNWNENKQRVNSQEYEHWDKNKLLDFYEVQAKAYVSQCQIKKVPLSIAYICDFTSFRC